jgi:hypothetical protein
MNQVLFWLLAALLCLLLASTWLLDCPMDFDAVQASALELTNVVADARSAQARHPLLDSLPQ